MTEPQEEFIDDNPPSRTKGEDLKEKSLPKKELREEKDGGEH